MKRKYKNIIVILLIIAVCGSIFFTIKSLKNEVNTSNTINNGDLPSDMPNNNGNSENKQNNDNEPPAKPEQDNSSNDSMNNSGNSNDNNVPIPPSDNNAGNNSNSSMATTPNNIDTEVTNCSISIVYYILFGIEGFILAILVIYLLLSNFNKKSMKETFVNKDKVIIAVLSSIILTFGVIFGSSIISTNSNKNNNPNNGNNMPNNNSSVSYSANETIKEDTTITSGDYSSTSSDENALAIEGDVDANISNITVNKTGDSDSGDNTSFYGTNSAIIAKDGANVTLKNINVETDANGANGVFCYGGSATTNNSSSDGTTINISDSVINTSKDNSGGIMTTGGGVMNASNLIINTAGTSSAAIRTDRGGGTVNVDGGVYTTTGQGSPTIYSTADITVKNAKLIAKASEGIVIEGKNSVTIENVDLTDTNNKLNGQSTTYKSIFLYQSMSGDAASGEASFTATNSNITTNKGDTFYVTNTTASIYLTNNTIINNDNTGNFLRIQKDSWGNSGSNGGNVTLTMSNQEASGSIVVDSISTLNMTIKNKSNFTGVINADNTAKSISLTLDKNSTIKLTGDSYITSLDNEDSKNSNIDFNGYTLYVNGVAIN